MAKIIKKNNEDKNNFSLPIVNKFICCFCMPLDSAVKLCTSLIMVWLLFKLLMSNAVVENIRIELIIMDVMFIICLLSLGLFFISSLKRNKNIKLMKQLLYFFPLIFIVCIYQIIAKVKNIFIENESIDYEELNTRINQITGEQGGSGEELRQYMHSMKYFSAAFEIAIFIFYLYYYIAVYSYIYKVEEFKNEQNQRRNLESGTE